MIEILVNGEIVNRGDDLFISTNAFKNNTNITSIDLKNYKWVNNSTKSAFANCSNLTSVVNIHEKVDDISGMFENCSNLTNTITIPNSVTNKTYYINGDVYKCYSLENGFYNYEYSYYVDEVYLSPQGNSLYFIYEDPYSYDPEPDSDYVDFRSINCGILSVSDSSISFRNYDDDQTYNGTRNPSHDTTEYKPDYKTVGLYYNCSNLVNANITSDTVTDLSYAFSNCINLTNVSINCTNLTSMPQIFSNCPNIESVSLNLPSVTDPSIIKAIFNDTSIKTVSLECDNMINLSNAFYRCNNLVNVLSLPSNIQDMSNTFNGCTNLVNISEIPDSVNNMTYTFSGCSKLSDIPLIPNNVNCLNGTFSYCSNLTNVTLETDTITSLQSTFYGCSKLSNISFISNSIISLPTTFVQCTNLVNAPVIPNSVTSMYRTFSYCSNLVNAPVIPNSVTDIQMTFESCSNLVNAPVIPNSVTSMYQTFERCYNLVNAPVIPNSVANMYKTFEGCRNLVNAPVIPNSVKDMTYTFSGCSNLVNAPEIPDSVKDMTSTFENCYNLVNVLTISNNITNMYNTFCNCSSLENIPEIPENVTIMNNTFRNCVNLTGNIIIKSQKIDNISNCFNGTTLDKNVYIPFTHNVESTLYGWNIPYYYATNIYPEVLYTKTESPLTNTPGQVFYENGTEFTASNIRTTLYNTFINFGDYSYNYSRNASYDIIKDGHTKTYNTFINNGYSTSSRKNGVMLFDPNGGFITFNVTPSLNTEIKLNGGLVSNNVKTPCLKNNEYMIYNPSYLLIVGHLNNIPGGSEYTITKDLTNESYNTITLNANVSDASVVFEINGNEYNAISNGTSYYINVNTDEQIIVNYTITKSGYKNVTGNTTFNNSDVSINITMIETEPTLITLQYPFNTNTKYLTKLITDSSIQEYHGYKIDSNYEAIIDNNYQSGMSWQDVWCDGYIEVTTTSSGTSQLLIHVAQDSPYSNCYAGIYVSTQQAYSDLTTSDFNKTDFDDGGSWLFKNANGHNEDYEGNDYTMTLQPNTKYYISFVYYIPEDMNYDEEYDPRFRIKMIKFTIDD